MYSMASIFRSLLLALLASHIAIARLPNIIFVLTDDQDLRLGSMQAMPTMRGIMHEGANLSNFFVHTPICCQSRATLLSGKYTHNVKSASRDADGCMHMNTSRVQNPGFWADSFIPALKKQGYTTGLFGKVLNKMDDYGCDGKHFAEGVDRSFIMCKIKFYGAHWTNFTATAGGGRDGGLFTSGRTPEDYSTTVLGNASLAWIRSIVESGSDHTPFFAWLGPHAPHLPSTPPPYKVDIALDDIKAPKDPMYGKLQEDKHAFFPKEASINRFDEWRIEREHTNRLKSLVAVDDVVRQIKEYLESVNEWDNTYLFYTSDHGYNLGQFRVDSHKTQVYDHNSRVPMIVKGPRVAKGSELPILTSMVDLAPTLLDLAAGGNDAKTVSKNMDGLSFAAALVGEQQQRWKGAALIEYRSIRKTDTAWMCRGGRLTEKEIDEYVSAYGYDVDSSLDEHGRPELCSSALLSSHWQSAAHIWQRHIHDGPNNTFAALRIIDGSTDLLYSEFVDVNNPRAWDFAEDQVNFRELYNVTEDYFMMQNVYDKAPLALTTALSQQLHAAIQCQGSDSCFTALAEKKNRMNTIITI
mmetsp:Transcript_93642/g.180696  ORF Transcript_93642/g.180696 Transcript_93642/m.180696 type:complete len:581 (+) Transcript_93642:35-1777(+)